MVLPDVFWQWQAEATPSAYVLALSGGLDSVVLLDMLVAQRARLSAPLRVCHVNHGWHSDAPAWSAHCAALCARHQLPFCSVTLDLPHCAQTSREAQARTARYAALAAQLPRGGVLLTAHHQDDQAETLLLQLLRGAGVAGLAAMPVRKVFADGAHWRPLLGVSRAALQRYAEQRGLHWVDDPSNDALCYARNRLRHTVLPLLDAAFPQATAQIARSAAWLAEAQDLLDEAADVYLAADLQVGLPWSLLAAHSPAWQRALVRRWLQRQGVRPPGHRRLAELLRQLHEGSGYAELVYADWVLLFYRDLLCVYPHTQPVAPPPLQQITQWPGIGTLFIDSADVVLQADKAAWRWSLYPPGQRFQPSNATHSKSLKHWFQQRGVAPYHRRRTPLLWHGERLAWVGGLGAASGYDGLVIDWQKPSHSVKILPVF